MPSFDASSGPTLDTPEKQIPLSRLSASPPKFVFRAKYHTVTAIERWFADGDFHGRYGRLRDVVVGPDRALYFLTNNRDGRGTPRPADDKIYRIIPSK